ncbi:MAG TPA: hypothetical protein VMZ28_30760 [Kofleriaceae bacterium]|nr:hypothetical protein [Kofleriaceae bacterium]
MRSTPIALALMTLLACKGEKDPPPAGEKPAGEGDTAAGPAKKKSNIVKIQMAVPYGKQVACADIFTVENFSKYVGDTIGEIKDKSSSNKEASTSCSFLRGGEAPKNDQQLKKFEKENMKLGVLPGDEYCMVTAYCSMSNDDPEQFQESCKARGDSSNEQLGVFACVHMSQRGVENAYTYKVVDPETKCMLEVMGGPSVTDEALVQKCTTAALEEMAPNKLTSFK